ncbi:hypothetical protein [Paraburkholderia silvatlantica]|uniref:hypothetical protein n=1 Tax=Paraburkholderia silvatlantica TaxID=321895 RepID=UPI000DA2533C|nr:hypothetical protein [Paraburkholderia silvatlantica]
MRGGSYYNDALRFAPPGEKPLGRGFETAWSAHKIDAAAKRALSGNFAQCSLTISFDFRRVGEQSSLGQALTQTGILPTEFQ